MFLRIDTVTSKVVLILGRFSGERKRALESIRDSLRHIGYAPVMFDFQPSHHRDLTETIQILASMAKFVVADLTDAKSIPQELAANPSLHPTRYTRLRRLPRAGELKRSVASSTNEKSS